MTDTPLPSDLPPESPSPAPSSPESDSQPSSPGVPPPILPPPTARVEEVEALPLTSADARSPSIDAPASRPAAHGAPVAAAATTESPSRSVPPRIPPPAAASSVPPIIVAGPAQMPSSTPTARLQSIESTLIGGPQSEQVAQIDPRLADLSTTSEARAQSAGVGIVHSAAEQMSASQSMPPTSGVPASGSADAPPISQSVPPTPMLSALSAQTSPSLSTAPPVEGANPPPNLPPAQAQPSPDLPKPRSSFWSVVSHLLLFLTIPTFFLGAVATFLVWQVCGKDDAHTEDQAREALNFQINVGILTLLLGASCLGWPLLGLAWILAAIYCLVAASHAGQGENYRYPLILRIVTH